MDELQAKNTTLSQDQEELDRLRTLYNLDTDYSEFEKVAAQVIGKDTGNWYSTFLINRGSSDGIAVDMNVIADGGLVGSLRKPGHIGLRFVRSLMTAVMSVQLSHPFLRTVW